jgi:hypothetical protein
MQTVVFSYAKQKIAVVKADSLEITQEPDGLLAFISGEILMQETSLVEQMMNTKTRCNVCITKEEETVIDQPFEVTFFAFEPDKVICLLQ